MSDAPWTIDRIADALGAPALRSRFLSEINRAPAHELLPTFARWERVAKNLLDAADRGRALAQHDARGEELPGEWIDATDRIQADAARARSRGAA
ncbi:hypothetical protein ACMA1D_02065 [Streptomyces sp. 796.1]|uniref:hypothetical protein n=1 Tax=Streptomyces sp. 796.1 TaxID=3163029 RepID=UPI0039C91EC4